MYLQKFEKFFFSKYLLLIFFFIVFKLPIVDISTFIIFVLFLNIILNTTEFKKKLNLTLFLIILLLISLTYIYDNKNIKENHGIFLPNNHNQNIYLDNNYEIFNILIHEFNNSFTSDDLECKNQPKYSLCWKDIVLKKVYSKSFDNINFGTKEFSRKINSINHTNLSNLRLGDINNIDYNWYDQPDFWWNKEYGNKIKRINAPYIVKYNFSNSKYLKSKICWKGNAIINDVPTIINNKKNECLKINKNFEILFFNFGQTLEVKLIKSIDLLIIDSLILVSQYLSIFLLIYVLIKKINFANLIYFISFQALATTALIYNLVHYVEFSFGYQPLQAGMDGLINEGYGRAIYENILNFNIIESLRGGENSFYFMPGLRYFLAIEKLFFGDNHYGVYLVLLFFPILFFILLKKINFTKKISLTIIILFIILKIPHLGFSFQHYIKGSLTLYSETPAIFCFFLCMIFLLNNKFFYSGLFCAIMVFLRPNYFPTFIILLFFNFINIVKYNRKECLFFFIGASFILAMPIHNYVFTNNQLILFVGGFGESQLLISPYEYLNMFQNKDNFNKIFLHLQNLLTTGINKNIIVYVINSIFLINLTIYIIIKLKDILKLNLKINILFCLIALTQISPLLFYNNISRYGFFSWLLITISNIIIFREYYMIKKVNNQQV